MVEEKSCHVIIVFTVLTCTNLIAGLWPSLSALTFSGASHLAYTSCFYYWQWIPMPSVGSSSLSLFNPTFSPLLHDYMKYKFGHIFFCLTFSLDISALPKLWKNAHTYKPTATHAYIIIHDIQRHSFQYITILEQNIFYEYLITFLSISEP